MQVSKLLVVFLCLGMFVPSSLWAQDESSPAQELLTDRDVERLTSMAELWSTVKYFHPFMAYQDIDWDSAMVATLPAILDADSPETYTDALNALLGALDDPATFVAQTTEGPVVVADSLEEVATWSADSILVVRINTNTLNFNDYVMTFQRLGQVTPMLSQAKGIVFDMRAGPGETGGEFIPTELYLQYSGLEAALVSTPLVVPGQRARMHNGFAPESGVTSGGYVSSFYINDSRLLQPNPGNKALGPIVFLVNQYGQLPSIAVSLQDAGLGAIVSEGGLSDASIVSTYPIEVGEGVTAYIRTTELVHADGTTGVGANKVVTPDPENEAEDPGLKEALQLAKNFKAEPVQRTELVPAAVSKKDAYPEQVYPSREMRALAAFKTWAVIRHFFPYYDLMDEDWDEVLQASLPEIVDAPDSLAYHKGIAKMYAHIQDTHGFINSSVLDQHVGRSPSPLFLQWIQEKPVVVGFRSALAAEKAGVEIGDIVLEIDGVPAIERINQLTDYLAASTPQALMRLAMNRLLKGEEMSMATIKLMGKDNQVKEVELERLRSYYQGQTLRTDDVIQLLPGNIGYADLDRLQPPQVEEMFERFKDTQAIIFDMRGYPNGTAWSIAPYLSKEGSVDAAYFFRNLLMGPNEESAQQYSFTQKTPPASPEIQHYAGKTLMLIDERTQSQAEHTGLFFAAANGTEFIGSHTSGANGDVTNFFVPGNINLTFSGHSVSYPDGRPLQRLGLVPTVEIRPTIEGLRNGQDEVLEAALKYLSEE